MRLGELGHRPGFPGLIPQLLILSPFDPFCKASIFKGEVSNAPAALQCNLKNLPFLVLDMPSPLRLRPGCRRLTQEPLGHRDQGIRRPLGVPVDGAAVHQRWEPHRETGGGQGTRTGWWKDVAVGGQVVEGGCFGMNGSGGLGKNWM